LTDPQKLTFQPCVYLWLSCHKWNTCSRTIKLFSTCKRT